VVAAHGTRPDLFFVGRRGFPCHMNQVRLFRLVMDRLDKGVSNGLIGAEHLFDDRRKKPKKKTSALHMSLDLSMGPSPWTSMVRLWQTACERTRRCRRRGLSRPHSRAACHPASSMEASSSSCRPPTSSSEGELQRKLDSPWLASPPAMQRSYAGACL
jgi:hypothetical protein